MKEKPILFSTPMVQAILEGRKTMTRRIVKPMPGRQSEWLTDDLLNEVPHGEIIKGGWQMHHPKAGQTHAGVEVAYDSPLGWIKCPYGQTSDLLWVRETWAPDLAGDDINSYIEYVRYPADGSRRPIKWVNDYSSYKNRPGIHMNKEYSRIWLQVIDLRVERLQDISESDAKAEGIEKMDESPFPYKLYSCNTASCVDAKTSFKFLWQDINGDDAWLNNPWVWVISFKVLSTTGKP